MAGTRPSAATVSSSSGTVARAARSLCFLPLPRGGRGRRGGRDDFLALLALDRSLGIMAGMDQKDFFALIVVYGSCMVKAGFTGYDTPRTFSLWAVGKPVMFGTMADMDQKAYCETALVVGIGSGL